MSFDNRCVHNHHQRKERFARIRCLCSTVTRGLFNEWLVITSLNVCICISLDQGIVDGDYELVPYQGGADAEGSLNAVHVEPSEASASDPNPALEGKHRSMNRSNFTTTVLLRLIAHLRFRH